MIERKKKRIYEIDSRKIQKGDTFVVFPEYEQYIADAKLKGAEECICMTRKQAAQFFHEHFNKPS